MASMTLFEIKKRKTTHNKGLGKAGMMYFISTFSYKSGVGTSINSLLKSPAFAKPQTVRRHLCRKLRGMIDETTYLEKVRNMFSFLSEEYGFMDIKEKVNRNVFYHLEYLPAALSTATSKPAKEPTVPTHHKTTKDEFVIDD